MWNAIEGSILYRVYVYTIDTPIYDFGCVGDGVTIINRCYKTNGIDNEILLRAYEGVLMKNLWIVYRGNIILIREKLINEILIEICDHINLFHYIFPNVIYE